MKSVAARVFAVLLCSALPVMAWAQATAPVTHDRHTHHHNPAHPTEEATEKRFHTTRPGAPLLLPTEEDAFSFVVFGDRSGGPNEGVDILAQAVADTNLLEPDLVMTVGDMIQGYNTTPDWLEQAKQYKTIMDELLCPWFPVAGNHDIYWRGPNKPEVEHEDNYEMHFGPLWYAFDHKDCRFIVLYSDEGDDQGNRAFRRPESQKMSDEQFTWLKEILAGAKDAQHIFVFIHHPRWLGRGYGEDWDKVHKSLVDAGNVSAVFAGHIHRMRYDPKDGIEYVTLATVGGNQSGHAPAVGFLHHFNLVTVRKNQIAMASLPVGGVTDIRKITGEVSKQAELLGRSTTMIDVADPVEIHDDGSVDQEVTVEIQNPSEFAIEIDLRIGSDDSRWTAQPDHRHAKIKPGKSAILTFKINRPAGDFDTTARALEVSLGIDMLTDKARFPIPIKKMAVPGSLKLNE